MLHIETIRMPDVKFRKAYELDVTSREACELDVKDRNTSLVYAQIGLDKGSHGKTIDFGEHVCTVYTTIAWNLHLCMLVYEFCFSCMVEVFQRQLELAKELERPVSVHCVRAFGDLLEILNDSDTQKTNAVIVLLVLDTNDLVRWQSGPFPAGVLVHSYMGSAEMVSGLANIGCYFSLSGFLTGMKSTKAKQMLKSIPLDRILLETDAPDALPKLDDVSAPLVPVPSSDADTEKHHKDSESQVTTISNESLNHPENIHTVLKFVASLLEMPEAELAELSYKNATKLFSYPGSKVYPEAEAI